MDDSRTGRAAQADDQDLPVELRRLWGLTAPARRGRPATLDVQRVVRAAVDLADRAGLDQVTLPAVAGALGCSTMALYRYVGSKDDLISLMGDVAVGEPPAIVARRGGWRTALRAWARALRLLNHRRPWLARAPVYGPPAGPHQVAWMEVALRALRDTGLDWSERLGVLMLISGYVRNETLLSQDLEQGRARLALGKAEAEQRYGRSLRGLIDPGRFPETSSLLASRVFERAPRRVTEDPTTDPDFTFGLERILDGVAVAIARAATRTDPARRPGPAPAGGTRRPARSGRGR